VRATIAILAVCLLMAQAPGASPQDLLERGRAEYASGSYADAARDLQAAADTIINPDQMRAYVDRGKFDTLPQFETAVVYLAMSYAKLGRDADAREQVQRLAAAESIAPTYANLALGTDRNDFENLRARLSGQATPPPAAVAAAPQPAPAPMPAPATSLTPDQQRELDQRIAQARAEFEKEADARIAAAKAEIERQAEERIAAERAAIEKQTQQQIAAIRAAAAQEVTKTAAPTIRRAEGLAIAGDVNEANAMYVRLLNTPNPSRDLVSSVAIGFYRTGDYNDALRAFERLGTFARGEEDLRYYKAVALYETGHYTEAKKELECALPFIEMTDDVNRYREKIEQMP
jgi:tetratricopeptide (TPR) repeat protein